MLSPSDRRQEGADFAGWAAHLGERVDRCGLAAVADDVQRLVATARDLGVALVAADVLADPAEPESARYRAFAVVVSTLVAW